MCGSMPFGEDSYCCFLVNELCIFFRHLSTLIFYSFVFVSDHEINFYLFKISMFLGLLITNGMVLSLPQLVLRSIYGITTGNDFTGFYYCFHLSINTLE